MRLLSLLVALVLLTTFVLPSAAAAAPAWDANSHPYAVGDQVTFQGATYQCLQPHTSQPGWDPVSAPALWQLVSGTGATPVPPATRTPTA